MEDLTPYPIMSTSYCLKEWRIRRYHLPRRGSRRVSPSSRPSSPPWPAPPAPWPAWWAAAAGRPRPPLARSVDAALPAEGELKQISKQDSRIGFQGLYKWLQKAFFTAHVAVITAHLAVITAHFKVITANLAVITSHLAVITAVHYYH